MSKHTHTISNNLQFRWGNGAATGNMQSMSWSNKNQGTGGSISQKTPWCYVYKYSTAASFVLWKVDVEVHARLFCL